MPDISTSKTNINFLLEKFDHPIEDIRFRAVNNILSKLERGLIPPECLSNETIVMNLLLRIDKGPPEYHLSSLRVLAFATSVSAVCEFIVKNDSLRLLIALRSNEMFASYSPIFETIFRNIQHFTSSSCHLSSKKYSSILDGTAIDCNLKKSNLPIKTPSQILKKKSPNIEQNKTGELISTNAPLLTLLGNARQRTHDQVTRSTIIEQLPFVLVSNDDVKLLKQFFKSLPTADDSILFKKMCVFKMVILSDFPSELFFQTDTIVKLFCAFITTHKSRKIQISAAQCLTSLCQKLIGRINYFRDPNNFSTKLSSSMTKESRMRFRDLWNNGFDCEYPAVDCSAMMPTIPSLCVLMISSALTCLHLSPSSSAAAAAASYEYGERFLSTHTPVISSLLIIVNTAVDLLLCCLHVGTEYPVKETLDMLVSTSPLTKSVLSGGPTEIYGLLEMLELWGVLLAEYGSAWRDNLESSDCSPQTFKNEVNYVLAQFEWSRFIYFALIRTLFRLVSSVWIPDECLFALPSATATELALALLDTQLLDCSEPWTASGDTHGLSAFVRHLDPEISAVWKDLVQIKQAFKSAADFIDKLPRFKDLGREDVEEVFTSALEGFEAMDYLSNSYVETFINFLAELSVHLSEEFARHLISRGRSRFLMLLAHPSASTRKSVYSTIHAILSTSITVDEVANPNSCAFKKTTFIVSAEVLGEMIEFGAQDRDPVISNLAVNCIDLLMDAHQLVPQTTWKLICRLINDCPLSVSAGELLSASVEWSPLQPLLLGLAPLTCKYETEQADLCLRINEACLTDSNFKGPDQSDWIASLKTMLLPLLLSLPSARLKASVTLSSLLDKTFNLIPPADHSSSWHVDGIHSLHDLETLICDLFMVSRTPPVLETSFDELSSIQRKPRDNMQQVNDFKSLFSELDSENIDITIGCSVCDNVFALLQEFDGIQNWLEAGGFYLVKSWLNALPSQLNTLTTKLLLEPLVKRHLGILQYIITRDVNSRNKLFFDSSCLLDLLYIGVCFSTETEIRHCISHIVSLILFHTAIRESEGSPICLPEIVTSCYCLPFICPVYAIKSRHNSQHPRFPHLWRYTQNTAIFEPDCGSSVERRNLRITVGVYRSLRCVWTEAFQISLADLVESCDKHLTNLYNYGRQIIDSQAMMNPSPKDVALALASSPSRLILRVLRDLRSATSHADAFLGFSRLQLLLAGIWHTPLTPASSVVDENDGNTMKTWWQLGDLQRFLDVLPTNSKDFHLLDSLLQTIQTVDFQKNANREDNGFLGHSRQTTDWILGYLTKPHSPLAYCLLRCDAGVGTTDSEHLKEAKQRIHFDTLPSFIHALLVCQHSNHSYRKSKGTGKTVPNDATKELLMDPTTLAEDSMEHGAADESSFDETVNNFETIELIFQWGLKFLEQHMNTPFEQISSIQLALKVLEQVILKKNWVNSAQCIDDRFGRIFECICALIIKIQHGVKCGSHSASGLTGTALTVLTKILLHLTTNEARIINVDSLGEAWLNSSWLLCFIHHQVPKIRYLAMTSLALTCLLPQGLNRLVALSHEYLANELEASNPRRQLVNAYGGGLWGLGFSVFLDGSETPKMRSAATHLLTNLAFRLQHKPTQFLLSPHAVKESSLVSALLPRNSVEQLQFLTFITQASKQTSSVSSIVEQKDWRFPLTIQTLREFGGLSEAALQVFSQASNDGMQEFAGASTFEVVVGKLNSNTTVSPIFIEPLTKIHVVGLGALRCILVSSDDFFDAILNLLSGYYPYDCLQFEEWELASSGLHSASTSSLTPPFLIGSICNLLMNMSRLLPDLVVETFAKSGIPARLMAFIDPKLLQAVITLPPENYPSMQFGSQLVTSYAACCRLFRWLTCVDNYYKILFLSDTRFLTLIVRNLTIIPDYNNRMYSLWLEEMLFIIALLEPEIEDTADILLRNALNPLATQTRKWGALINHFLSYTLAINADNFTRKSLSSTKESDRKVVFDLTYTSLNLLSVVLSRRSSRLLDDLKLDSECVSEQTSIRSSRTSAGSRHCDTTNKTMSSASLNPRAPAPLRFDNPVPVALDSNRIEDGEETISECISVSLTKLTESFPSPRVAVDGSFIDTEAEGGIKTAAFGHLLAHRQAVHTALKLLLATSLKAKHAVIRVGFTGTLCSLCLALVEKLSIIIQRRRAVNLGIRAIDRLEAGQQAAWRALMEELLRHLELLGNLLHASPEAKLDAVRAELPKLALSCWPLGLQDSRLMHAILFCLINFSADCPSAANALLSCSGPCMDSLTTTRPSSGSVTGPLSFVRHLSALLTFSLNWYSQLSANYRPPSDTTLKAKYADFLSSSCLAEPDNYTFQDLTMRQLFDLLSNMAFSTEAISCFAKVKILTGFAQLDHQTLVKTPRGLHLQQLWIKVLNNFSFTQEGQQILLNTPGIIDGMLEMTKLGAKPYQLTCLLSLQNLCSNHTFKNIIMSQRGGLLPVLAGLIDSRGDCSPEIYALVLSTLMAAGFKCQKFRLMLRAEGFSHRLINLQTLCRENKSLFFLEHDVKLLLNYLQT